MKQTKYLFFAIISIALVAFASCTSMDDYLKYTDGKEIIYTGQVDYAVFRSGEGRVVFTGYLISDPNIDKVVASWPIGAGRDSIVIDDIVNKREGASFYAIEHSIPLAEGNYEFRVTTFDTKGNTSVVRTMTGSSFGENYKKGLYDRPVQNVKQEDGYVEVSWYGADETTFVELEFEDELGLKHQRIITANMDTAMLWNCKEISPISIRTCFLPNYSAIDTFKLEKRIINADANYTEKYIQNSGAGGVGMDGTVLGTTTIGADTRAECGYPAGWIVSDEVKVSEFIQGWISSRTRRDRSLNFYSTREESITNGKVYQTTSIEKIGQYTLSYNCLKGNPPAADWTKVDVYLVVAKGNALPDISKLRLMEQNNNLTDNTLAFYHIEKGIPVRGEDGHNATFKISSENEEITFGFVMDLTGDKSMFQVNEVKLIYDAVF